VSERNPNVARAADVSVFPGVHYVYDVIDLSAPSYAAARGLVGFQDSPSSAKSPLCSGADVSDIRLSGSVSCRRSSLPGNTGVTCRLVTP